MLLCLLDFSLWPRWSNRTGFTLISVKNSQIDKICEAMIFKTLDIRKQRTMSKRGKNGVSPGRPSWLPWEFPGQGVKQGHPGKPQKSPWVEMGLRVKGAKEARVCRTRSWKEESHTERGLQRWSEAPHQGFSRAPASVCTGDKP